MKLDLDKDTMIGNKKQEINLEILDKLRNLCLPHDENPEISRMRIENPEISRMRIMSQLSKFKEEKRHGCQ